jgi:hypothetical protein
MHRLAICLALMGKTASWRVITATHTVVMRTRSHVQNNPAEDLIRAVVYVLRRDDYVVLSEFGRPDSECVQVLMRPVGCCSLTIPVSATGH